VNVHYGCGLLTVGSSVLGFGTRAVCYDGYDLELEDTGGEQRWDGEGVVDMLLRPLGVDKLDVCGDDDVQGMVRSSNIPLFPKKAWIIRWVLRFVQAV
jgi:hypothetical protein